MSIAAMKQALEALEIEQGAHAYLQLGKAEHIEKAITALRTAIAKAEKQEPYGYFQYDMGLNAWVQNRDSNKGVAFYTTSPVQEPEFNCPRCGHCCQFRP